MNSASSPSAKKQRVENEAEKAVEAESGANQHVSTYMQIMGDSNPTFTLKTPSKTLNVASLPDLWLYILGSQRGTLMPVWCNVEYRGRILQIVCVYLHGVSEPMWNDLRIRNAKNDFCASFSPYQIVSLRPPWDEVPFWKRRQREQQQDEEGFKLLVKDRMAIIQWDTQMLRGLFYVKKEKPMKQRKDYSTMGSVVQALREENGMDGTKKGTAAETTTSVTLESASDTTTVTESITTTTHETVTTVTTSHSANHTSTKVEWVCTIDQLLLSEHQLRDNLYPNRSEHTSFISLPKGECKYKLVGVDCEMCETSVGKELTRVTFVDTEHNVLYDQLVKPRNEITNYYTIFSGITEEMLQNVIHSLDDVHEYMRSNFTEETVFVGHSLENDLMALQLVHDRVIDTAVLFPHQNAQHKHSLKNLCKRWLQREIQTAGREGHDSVEDARAAMELTLKKLENGLNFGKINIKQENFLKQVSKDKSICLIDDHHDLRYILNGAAAALPSQNDEDTTSKAVNSITKRGHNFVWTHYHAVEKWYEKNAKDLVQKEAKGEKDATTTLPKSVETRLLQQLQTIYAACPNHTLLCVVGTPEMYTLQEMSEKYTALEKRNAPEQELSSLRSKIEERTRDVKTGSFAHFCLKGVMDAANGEDGSAV